MMKIQKIIREFIASEAYTNTTIHYDMNVIKIRLHENHSDERYIFFYIYPPWRIICHGKIVNSSDMYPQERNTDEEIDYTKMFHQYTKSTQELTKQRITDVIIKPESFDLTIKWADETILESCNLNENEWSYHIYDTINGKSYDASYGKIAL